jgi:hypothetical protein
VFGYVAREGRASFGIELAAGGRSVHYTSLTNESLMNASVSTGVVEPRARAEYWVSPYLALGAQAGTNVLARGDWMAGAYLSVHTRAFGGL